MKILHLFIFCFFLIFSMQAFSQQQIQKKTILDFKDTIGLTEEQESEIKKIIEAFEKKSDKMQEDIENQRKKVVELLKQKADMKEIDREIKKFFSLRADLVIEEIRAGREIDKLLSPQQLSKWDEIRIKGGVTNSNNMNK